LGVYLDWLCVLLFSEVPVFAAASEVETAAVYGRWWRTWRQPYDWRHVNAEHCQVLYK